MTVEEQLKRYKEYKSKVKLYEVREKELLQKLELSEVSYISSSAWSHIPKSITNKFNSVVENTVIERENIKKDNAKILHELNNVLQDKFYYQCELDKTEALLICLSAKEKFIIEKFYFDAFTWNDVVRLYIEKFGLQNERTVRQLKRIRDDAIKKMEKIKVVA